MRISWWNVGYWAALLLTGILVVMLVLNRQELARELASREEKIQQVEAEIAQKRREIQQVNRRLASIQADQLYMQDAVYATMDILDVSGLEPLCRAQPDNAYAQLLCRYQDDLRGLIRLFNAAARSRTATPKDYQATIRDYQALARHIRGRQPGEYRDQWLAIALEGIAYSQLKLNRPREAGATIAEAATLDPTSAIVGITALKIGCVQRSEAEEVRTRFGALRQKLDREVARTGNLPPDNILRRNAALERQLLDQDAELYLMCGYANLPARPATSS